MSAYAGTVNTVHQPSCVDLEFCAAASFLPMHNLSLGKIEKEKRRKVYNFVSLIQHKVIPNICITASASAAMVTPSADSSVSNGVYVPGGITNGDVKPAISTTPLADFLMQLEEYTPTVSQALPVGLLYAAFTD